MKNLLIATMNSGKMEEIRAILNGVVGKVFSAADFTDMPHTLEDGATFTDNAIKKAREAMLFTGLPALADDSGLAVDVLAGAPGVLSARFAGVGATDAANNSKLLAELADTPPEKRQAAFICVMALVTPESSVQLFSGRVTGKILAKERGSGGFGYDPLFLVDGFDKTMAELTIEEKNRISHRGEALQQFIKYIKT